MGQPQLGVDLLHAVHKESRRQLVQPPSREADVPATLRTGEGLAQATPQGQLVQTLLAVVVAARQHLGLLVVLVTDGASDLLFQDVLSDTFSHGRNQLERENKGVIRV